MWRKLLCYLEFHNWVMDGATRHYNGWYSEQDLKCKHCPAKATRGEQGVW